MYYLCSENKGADQLRGYREADLHLCFRIRRLLVFPRGGSNKKSNKNQMDLIKYSPGNVETLSVPVIADLSRREI